MVMQSEILHYVCSYFLTQALFYIKIYLIIEATQNIDPST